MSQSARPSSSWPMALLSLGLLLMLVAERVAIDATVQIGLGWSGGVAVLLATLWRGRRWLVARGRLRRAELLLFLGHSGVLTSVLLFRLQTPTGLTLLGLTTAGNAATVLTITWLTTLLISLGAVLAMERAWLTMPIAPAVEPQRLQSVALGAIGLVFALIFVVGINYAATKRDLKRDVTFFKTTQPSSTSERLVHQLEEPVTALLFFASTSDVLPQVRPYFETLAADSPQLRVILVDHALEPELAQRYRVRGNGFVVLVRGDNQHATNEAPPHERFEVGEQIEQARRALRKLDASFQQYFSKLTRPPRRIRFTSGHQERTKSGQKTDRSGSRLQAVHRLLTRFNIGSDGLGLGDGLGKTVPKGTSAVLAMGPRRRFLEEEVQSLIRYVERGGRLLLMVDPVTADTNDGLAPLLARFGVRRLAGTALSSGHHMRSTFNKADRALVYSNTFGSHPSVSSASRNSLQVAALLSRAATFERIKPAPAGVQVNFPMTSSADFWRDLDGDLERGKREPLGRVNLMAAVSVAQTGSATAKPATPNAPKPAVDEAEGRLVVIGDGDFVTDALVKADGNTLIFVDSLRWLIGEQRVAGTLTSEEDVPIEHRKAEDRLWFYATTFALPLPLLLLGLWIGRRRRTGGR